MEKVNILVVTDAQVDFHNGALGTKEAQASVPAIVKKNQNIRRRGTSYLCNQRHPLQQLSRNNGGKESAGSTHNHRTARMVYCS